MTQTIRPFLMFEGRAEPAMRLYTSLFDDGEVLELARRPSADPEKPGLVLRAAFRVGGQTILCSDSDIHHGFTFTPSSSLFVDCGSEAEIDRLAGRLAEGGQVLMPLDNYGFSRRFAWVNDRFGVSWQLNLA
jgi:predicted 3-demethylubiquinone-9 3-methyltransferase (glyoxalase superfamily)